MCVRHLGARSGWDSIALRGGKGPLPTRQLPELCMGYVLAPSAAGMPDSIACARTQAIRCALNSAVHCFRELTHRPMVENSCLR